jgi:hypothetical protein
MTGGRVWGVVGAVMLTAGCATAPASTPVTDLKDVAGLWNGWTTAAGGEDVRVSLLVQVDGQYRMILERRQVYYGRLMRDGEGLRFRHSTGNWVGSVTLREEPGVEYLRFVLDTGALWIQFERPQ